MLDCLGSNGAIGVNPLDPSHHNILQDSDIFESIGILPNNGRSNLLKRCLENLINNSIKYANNTYLKLTKSSNYTIVIVEDDGPGLPVNEYENVFKPFYKIDKSRGDSKSSVGLGLSIANDVIKSHGGNIKLDNSNFGGLQVNIFLPS